MISSPSRFTKVSGMLRGPTVLLLFVLLVAAAAEDQTFAVETELTVVNCNLRVELADLKASQGFAEAARLKSEVVTLGEAKVTAEKEVQRLTLENAELRLEKRVVEEEVERLKQGRDQLAKEIVALRSELFEELRLTKMDMQVELIQETQLLKVFINQTQAGVDRRLSEYISEANNNHSKLQQELQKYKEEGGVLVGKLAVQLTHLNTTLQPMMKGLLKIAAMNMVQLGVKQYYISNEAVSWSDARHFCLQHHLDLVAIETREENDMIVSYLSETLRNNADYWTAGKAGPSGLFSWVSSGQDMGFADWYNGHYERSLAGGKCMVVYSRELVRKWEVRSCSTSFRYICETTW